MEGHDAFRAPKDFSACTPSQLTDGLYLLGVLGVQLQHSSGSSGLQETELITHLSQCRSPLWLTPCQPQTRAPSSPKPPGQGSQESCPAHRASEVLGEHQVSQNHELLSWEKTTKSNLDEKSTRQWLLLPVLLQSSNY